MAKKILNAADNYVDESLDGLCAAFPSYVRSGEGGRVIARSSGAAKGKVGVVSGGGFGHLPVFAGYVGEGLLTSCAVGQVFAGPTVGACADAIRAASGGAGVLCLYGNYGGDRMNFDLACEEAGDDGIETETVLVTDDVASAAPSERQKRRGVAGLVFAFKIAGAAAAAGKPLADVAAVARKAVDRCRTIGAALSPCLIPGAAKPGFSVGDDEIEIGMGIHGEPGISRRKLMAADPLAELMLGELLKEAPDGAKRVAVLVNSLGATPVEELLILYRRAAQILQADGFTVAKTMVGHYATSMEMAGFSMTLLYLDDELEAALRAPAICPFWPGGQ